MNIAASALGGRVEQVSSVANETGWLAVSGWSPSNLNDNGTGDFICTPLCGWASKDASFPIDVVLSFHQGREAIVGRVLIDTLTPLTRSLPQRLPKAVEISVSRSSPSEGFTPVASVELPPESGQRAIDFAPTPAKYLRVRILSSHGGDRVLVGEIEVFEAAGPTPSILEDFPRNLALPALGGALVSFTSDYATYGAYRLVDGDPATDWRSADAYLPQEFVFAFRDDQVALIDRIVLTTTNYVLTGPKVVTVSTSLHSPVEGFAEVGRFTLKQDATAQSFPVRRRARFVKLRILDNSGSKVYTNLGEVQLFEASEASYESVLFRGAEAGNPLAATRQPGDTGDGDNGTAVEQEKNDEVARANLLELGRPMRGQIDPIGENDYFTLSVPGPDRSMLTVDLSGRPNIRTSLSLINGAGASVKQFDPARVPAEDTSFSWLVDSGEYALRLTQPPASVVVVWDTSGSMERSVKDLQRAVEGYLDQVSPTERVNLIRFSYDIETLLPEFTSDRDRLKKATAGKFFADGATPFYDVVAKAAGLLDGVQGNRAIVIMTDGEDAGSHLKRSEYWQLLQDKGIRLYTIGLGDIDRYSARLASSAQRLLAYTAMATNGRAYFSKNSDDLAKFYQEISEDLRRTCAYRLKVTRARATGTLEVRATGERITAVAAPSQIELILDASGSMKRRIGGRMMIDTAKQVLADVVKQLPEDMRVALRVYGHRIREGRPGACEDSELVFPFARLDRQRLLTRIQSVRALGTTPIAYSLQQIARDVGSEAGEKMVVLVTDGREECGGDPAAAVSALQSRGIKLKLNIVGFALADAGLKAELQRLAGLANGQFVEARDAQSLRSAIEQSLAVPYDVLDGGGTTIAQGVTGQPGAELPEGVYTVRVRAEKPIEIEHVRIDARQTTTVELKKEGRELGVRVSGGGVP